MSDDTLRTEIASSVLIKVQEVLSPDLHEGLSILGTIPRIYTVYSSLHTEIQIRRENGLRVCSICMVHYYRHLRSLQSMTLIKELSHLLQSQDCCHIRDRYHSIN